MRLNEFSTEKLAQYKTAAAADAAKADAEGDFARGDKRFKGINTATKKQFDNDAKKSEVKEVAPPGAKAERMVRHIKAGYARDGKLTPKEKGIAFATAWKAHNAGRVEEQGVAEGSIKDVEAKIRTHDQRKADREQAGDPYVAHEIHSHNVIRKQLLDKRKRAQAEYHKKMDQQDVAEGSKVKTAKGYGDVVQGTDVKTIAKADLGKNKLNLPKGYGDVVQPQKLKTIAKAEGVADGSDQQLSIRQLATISDEALDKAYGYGRSSPGNTFGWQANLKSAAYAKHMIDKGVTDIDEIADAIHKGWNVTAKAFVKNPDRFDDTEKLKAAGKLEAKLQQRAKLMNIDYSQLPDDEQEKDRVVARALFQAITGGGEQGITEGHKESYIIVRTDREGKKDVFAGNFDTYEQAQKELDACLAHPLHTKYKQKFEIKRKGHKDITEMDKSQTPPGRDGGPREGPEKIAKPITKDNMVKHASDILSKSMVKKDDKKKDVSEDQLDELSKDTLKDYMRAQPARIKGPAGLATTNPKKAARIVDPEKGDMRRALTKLKDPEYGQQGVAEDSIAAMRRLAGIVPQVPTVVSNGQRQYRHMPTAVQPR